ncbi:MAG: hypothetical protein ABFD52_08220 [Acidobacteriota bacterium]
MDAFRTEAETDFRRRAAEYFERIACPGRGDGALPPEKIWADLDGEDVPGRPDRRVSVLEEAADRDPRLGRALLDWRASAARLDPPEETACRLGRLAGTASHVLRAGTAAARERGDFASSLMGCRETQERLARLVSLADLARLGACRLCRLLDRGDGERAGLESDLLRARAEALDADVRAAAMALLGEDWVARNLPAERPRPVQERISP